MVVVGAGVAGFTAAQRLARARLSVVVLEARPRIGGRIDTQRLPGWPAPVEAGAEFVHGEPRNLMRALAEAGARLGVHRQRHERARRGGGANNANKDWMQAQAVIDELPREDVAVMDVLRRPDVARRLSPAAREMVVGFVEGFNASDATRVSAQSLAQQAEATEAEGGDGTHRVLDGYNRLPRHLAAPLLRRPGALRLSTIVTDVRWGRAGVDVGTRAALGGPPARVRARAALITLPLGVLQAPPSAAGAVRFVPALPPAKQSAIRRLAMGTVIKVVLRLRQPVGAGVFAPFGREMSFVHLGRAAVPTWWVPRPFPPTMLVGWVAGRRADAFAARFRTAEARLHAALGGLARALKTSAGAVAAAIEDAHVFDWGADPWSRGAYSWVPVGGLDAPAALAVPLGGRLFFAGEATDMVGDPGTVHGAMATGLRAATEIIAALRRR